jgi:hypothetical protein
MSYINWTPRSTFTLVDGSTLVGHSNYSTDTDVEIRTDAGEFRTVERDQIVSTRPIKKG